MLGSSGPRGSCSNDRIEREEREKSFSHVRLFGTTWTAVHQGDSPGKNTGMGCHAFPQGIFPIQDQTQVSHSADGFFIIKPPGKLKNTGVGSLSLLQGELPNPGMELVSSSLQADSLLADCVGDSQTRQQADNSYSVRTKSVPGNVLDAGKTI